MKTLASAQADFRANDRDGNTVNDFWTADISGLYTLEDPEGERIKLIDIDVAGADANPVTDIHLLTKRVPKSGYLYVSLRPPDAAAGRHPDAFGVCSYPAEYGVGGKYCFILNEQNKVYKKDLGRPGGIHEFPADPEAEGWVALD